MPSMRYTLSNFQRTVMDYKPGQTFTATATGTPVSNATMNAGRLCLGSIKTWSTQLYMTFALNGATGTTASTFKASTTYHAETVELTAFSQSLLTCGSGTVTFTVNATGTWKQTIFLVQEATSYLELDYTLNYSKCTAPTAVSINANNVAPGKSVTLSWSGAKAGNGMGIASYQVYRATSATGSYSLLTTVTTTATSGSISVAAQSTNGASYYYKVVTVGSVSGYNSAQSSVYATLTCSFSAPTVPSTVTIGGGTSAYATAGANVTLAWSGAAAGTNNPITGYIIYRNGVEYQTIASTATSGSVSVPAHATAGSNYSYTVCTKGTYSSSGASAARVVYTYSAPTAPTSVAVSNASPDAGANVTLSWSGAAAGSHNPITAYQVHRATSAGGSFALLTTITTTAASGSCTVTAHATMGSAYYYKVLTVGQRANSPLSASYATLTSKGYTTCKPPTTLALSASIANPGSSTTLMWSGAEGGTNNPVASYAIYRAGEAAGTYSQIGTASVASFAVKAHDQQGQTYYYKIAAIGTKAGFDSPLSTVYAALKSNSAPAAPVVHAPASGKVTGSPRPRLLVTVGADADGHTQQLAMSGYLPSSTGQLTAGRKVVFMRSTEITAAMVLTESVTSTDAFGLGSTIFRSFSYVPVAYTDDTLVPGSTPIRAVHISELRTAVDIARGYYGLAPFTWGEAITAGHTSLAGWKTHVLEIRAAMEEIAAFVNGWDTGSTTNNIVLPAWTEITVNKPTAEVMRQLRAATLCL